MHQASQWQSYFADSMELGLALVATLARALGLRGTHWRGYLVARVLVDRDKTVSVAAAAICTGLFVLVTALVMGRDFLRPLIHPSDYIRSGSPFFAFEAYLLLTGRWIIAALLSKYSGLNDTLMPDRLSE